MNGAWPAWNDPALRVASDPPRRARYRALQSWYREAELHAPPGRHPSGRLVGSLLPAELELAGLNFLDDEIADLAERRAAEVVRAGGTLDRTRLRRNLLSSMPLCFNVFTKLSAERAAAAHVLGAALDLDIATVDDVLVEHAPVAAKAELGDRTAFDAFVIYTTTTGVHGFLGMETKYTEPFTPTVFPAARYESLPAYRAAGFKPGAARRLQGPGTNQLWRNLLLAAATRANDGFGAGHVVVLAGEDDRAARRAVAAVSADLVDPDQGLRSLTLERLVEACLPERPLADWAAEFRRRYLDLSPVAEGAAAGPTFDQGTGWPNSGSKGRRSDGQTVPRGGVARSAR